VVSHPTLLASTEEAALARFDDTWQAGLQPDPADYVPPDAGAAFLRELVLIDLEWRFKAGEAPAVESYLARFPALAAADSAVLDVIVAEANLRRWAGRPPGPDEYQVRFPHLADRLRDRLDQTTELSSAAADTPPYGIAAPAELGRYRVTGTLGWGGMGVVYRATDPTLDREVAVKVIRPGLVSGARAVRHVTRFLAEARTVAAIRHPNVVPVYEVGEHAGRPFLAMEYCPGGTLAGQLAGPHDPRAAAELVRKVGRGVQAAHQEEIVHRDLKPGNVLFDAAGEPKVTDFGLAKRAGGPSVTQTQAAIGTPAYMAPEQARGQRELIGPATDVWALGVILYELLTGRRPFDGPNPWAVMARIADQQPAPSVRRFVPSIPRDLDLICQKCLEPEPRNRYPSAGPVADDLGRFLAGQTVCARPAGAWVAAGRWSRRNPLAAGLLVVSVLLLVGGLAGMTVLWQRADRQRQAAEEQRAAADRSRAEAEVARQDARDALAFQQDLFQASDPFGFNRPVFVAGAAPSKDVTAKDLLDRGRRAVEVRPLSPLSRAAILHSMGHAYRGLGETEKADPLLREALAIRREHLGERHEDYIETLLAVGLLRHIQLQSDEAARVFRQALALSREVYPAGDPRVGDAAFYLAYALLLQFGPHNPDRDEGGALLDEAERIYRAAGNRKRELSRVQSAQFCLRLYREGPRLNPLAVAAEVQAQADGPEKDLFRDSFLKYQFAVWARQRRDLVKAEALHRELLETAGRMLEPSHILYVAALGDYGTLLRDMGRTDRAYEIFAGVYDLLRRHPLRHHPKLTEPLTYYGTFLIELKKWSEAEPVLRDALRCARENGQQSEARALAPRLAAVLRELGRGPEAEAVEQSLAGGEKKE
jgi:tetratricopeptide (TPR) repeat protein